MISALSSSTFSSLRTTLPPPAAAPKSVAKSADTFEAAKSPYAPNQRRPKIAVARSLPALADGDGKPSRVDPGTWAVSSVSGSRVVLYRKGGKIRVVEKSRLIASVKEGADRRALLKALDARSLKTRSAPPAGTMMTVKPVNVPDKSAGSWVPPGGSNNSITGRGAPLWVWGTTTPTGNPGSGTGYAGFPMKAGSRFVEVSTQRGVDWEDKTNPSRKAKVTWALGYAEQPNGTWVKQYVVKSIEPKDGGKRYDLLSP